MDRTPALLAVRLAGSRMLHYFARFLHFFA
jgi:hypothetical protein